MKVPVVLFYLSNNKFVTVHELDRIFEQAIVYFTFGNNSYNFHPVAFVKSLKNVFLIRVRISLV